MNRTPPTRALGEFELIGRFFDRGPARRAALGIGDDAALLPASADHERVVTTDMLVAGRHFFDDVEPASLGHKALAVNLSDLAAMGASPEAFTLAVALPGVDETWLAAFARGLFALADAHGCELVGGDTTRGPLCISITAIGRVPTGCALRRDGAQPGDDVWVSGALGAAAAAVLLGDRVASGGAPTPGALAERLDRPQPRLALGIELRHLASAAIDVSDGLLADLGHVAERSRLAMRIEAGAVPIDGALADWPDAEALRLALTGGDDYELAFTAPVENRHAIGALGSRLSLPLSRIGTVLPGDGVGVVDSHGLPLAPDRRGFDHFAADEH
ncbi:MAG: thiamine-phosphate kinase [Burkholderiaceae bacterium]